MFYIGLNSGTSIDAIDAAIVDINNDSLTLHTFIEYPIPETLREKLFSVNKQTPLNEIAKLNIQLGKLFSDAVIALLDKANIKPKQVNAIGLHGQTVLHSPTSSPAYTIQLGDANTVVANTSISVVNDFRGMDISLGGEGAPLAPIFHKYQFANNNKTKVILNIGGIANISILNANANKPVIGFDTGPGNGLMNAWIKRHQDKEYDTDGKWAAQGQANEDLLNILMDDKYFQLVPPKSTGREYFNLDWLHQKLIVLNQQLSPEDIQATLLSFTTNSIVRDISFHAKDCEEVIVCGGGAYNSRLMNKLNDSLDCKMVTSDNYSISPDAIEACLFAWLASCRINKTLLDLTTITGSSKPCILGAIYHN